MSAAPGDKHVFTTTRCPHCEAAFAITHIQMAAANGLVRCGRCQRLFQAEPVASKQSKFHPGTVLTPARRALLANIDKAVLLTESPGKLKPGSLADSDWQKTTYNPLEHLEKPTPRITWRSALLALGMAAVLVAQIAWFNMAILMEHPRTSAHMGSLCQTIPCNPPISVQLPVVTRDLAVRSHPLVNDALLIRIVLRNNSYVAQSFPALSLTFTSSGNDIVARRIFTPEEYLAGELLGETRIPPDYDIHVALAMVDPGSAADRYHLELLPTQ